MSKATEMGITPACAGKSRKKAVSAGIAQDHPRVCGEKVETDRLEHARIGSPPRMRGKGNDCPTRGRSAGITPAHAGKSDTPSIPQTRGLDHPRTCGEKLLACCLFGPASGSPPHMRGKVNSKKVFTLENRITPAHAGKRIHRMPCEFLPWDHPRTCGEKLAALRWSASILGSPPHMRGKVRRSPGRCSRRGITPAHAGKSDAAWISNPAIRDHPRTCGEKHLSGPQ